MSPNVTIHGERFPLQFSPRDLMAGSTSTGLSAQNPVLMRTGALIIRVRPRSEGGGDGADFSESELVSQFEFRFAQLETTATEIAIGRDGEHHEVIATEQTRADRHMIEGDEQFSLLA